MFIKLACQHEYNHTYGRFSAVYMLFYYFYPDF